MYDKGCHMLWWDVCGKQIFQEVEEWMLQRANAK